MTGRNRRLLAGGVVLAVTVAVTTPVAAVAAPADHPATRAVLDRHQAQAGPGAAVHAGDETGSWTLSSGAAKIGQNRPVTSTEHFRIGSQTKTFTAAVVLQLVDEGRVALDAPIGRYLPGVVTGYSNVAFLVLGLLVERVTGRPARDAITERVITPLGLTHTWGTRAPADPYLPGCVGGRVGPFFFWTEGTTDTELTFWSTAGAVASTLEDLAAFYGALLDGRVVSAAALAEMRRTTAPDHSYGLALSRVDLTCGGEAWGHNGALPNGHCSITLTTDDGRFASLVTNGNVVSSRLVSIEVLDTALCEEAA
ncbi:serine hydrolase domain-containing protein [Saccharothrix texasensis]|uniref:Beta-lactamase n=1 Tax=Saccharothrix texasensis TaxID=103734 RepID=A0A3N1GXW6_9PSEU|nr:serine hydrolase domain-containing protein [Saccharothrix texasensis]ROP35171.1 beta-lactamase [Saccharothrix texasensis]